MARRRNALIQWLQTTLLIGFSRVMSCVPWSIRRGIGRLLGRLGYRLVPRAGSVARRNIEKVCGETLSEKEKDTMAREAVENVGIVAAEFSMIPSITPEFVEKYVRIEGWEHIEPDSGGLVLGAHLGNWEWMAPIVRTRYEKVAEVIRPLDDPRLNRFVDSIRRGNGVETIPKEGAGTEIIRKLRQGYLVGVLIDQSPRYSAVPVSFMGLPCWATIAPVMAALRARCPVYPLSLVRDPGGTYVMRFGKPVLMERNGQFLDDLVKNVQRCQDAVEQMIRSHPGQWLWLHRRWKKRERLEQEWKARKARN